MKDISEHNKSNADFIRELELLRNEINDLKKTNHQLLDDNNRLQSLYDDSPDMYVSVSPIDGTIKYCNQTLLNNMGYTKNEVIGKHIFELYAEECMEEVKDTFDKFVHTGRVKDKELILKRKDGSKIDVSLNVEAVLDKNGKIMYSMSSWRDISSKKKSEQLLKETEERYKRVIDASNTGIWDWNLKTNQLYYSPRWKSMLGYEDHELNNEFDTFASLLHPDDKENLLKGLDEFLINPVGNFHQEFRLKHKNGNYRWILNHSSITKDQNGQLIYMSGSHLDITEQKIQENKIKRNSELNQALLYLYKNNYLKENELIQISIDKAVELLDSEIGYFHFFDKELNEIKLVTWSSGTFKSCDAAYDNHYPIEKAGIWADSIRKKKPIIINDYPNLKNKNGMPDGHFPVKNHLGVPIFNGEKIVGIIGVGNKKSDYTQEDISQLEIFTRSVWEILKGKRANQQIKLNEEKYRLLFENMNEGFAHAKIICNQEGEPVDWEYININPAFETQTGLKRKNVIGNKISKILPGVEKDAADWIGLYGKVAITGTEMNIEEFSGPLQRWYSVHAFCPKKGEFAATFEDITEKKIVEQQLQEAIKLTEQYNKDLEASNKELEQFAYVSSHDLQEPLRKIRNYTELLESKYYHNLGEQGKEYVQIITNGVTRMQKLIDDLLEYSRISTRGAEFTNVDLNETLASVIDCLELPIINSKATINKSNFPVIRGDESQIFQLFLNLVGNALKFKTSENPVIDIGSSENKTNWHFTVKDNGIGMEMQYAEKIFTVFQRLHPRSRYQGTGIGLAICKKIVERHKGKIWVKSEPKKGATFHFTISKNI